jgi:hypothetical protein
MSTQVKPGEVLHWKGFRFENGASANKFFVVLGAKPGHNWLFVMATSQRKRRQYQPGCHERDGYFHIPNGGRDFFTKDTWLLLMRCFEIDPKEAEQGFANGDLRKRGVLRPALIDAIRECARKCEDVSAAQLALL